MLSSWEEFAEKGWSDIRRRLQELRGEGMTLQQIADLLGKSKSHVKGLIDGDRSAQDAPLTQFFRYLDKLGIRYRDYMPLDGSIKQDRSLIPIYGLAGAGYPLDETTPQSYISVPEEHAKRCDFAVEVSGDSMLPTIPNNSVCGIRRDSDFVPNHVYLAYVPQEGHVVKRIRLDLQTNCFVFHSDNPDQIRFPEFSVAVTSSEKIILGVVRWILRADI